MRIDCHLFETAERIAVAEGGIVGSGTALDTEAATETVTLFGAVPREGETILTTEASYVVREVYHVGDPAGKAGVALVVDRRPAR